MGFTWIVLLLWAALNPPGKKPPDPKPNFIPNLALTLPLTPHDGLFSGGIFLDTHFQHILIWFNNLKLSKGSWRSSHPEVFLGKGVLKICCKFTTEHLWRSVISIKLLCTSVWAFSCKFAAYFQNTFSWEHLWTAASIIYNLGLESRKGNTLWLLLVYLRKRVLVAVLSDGQMNSLGEVWRGTEGEEETLF